MFRHLYFYPMIGVRIFSLFFLLSTLISSLHAQGFEVKGQVLGPSGQILDNVHVINKRTTKGTITNSSGDFRIFAQTDDTLVFSIISYSYHYHKVRKEDADEKISISLQKQNFLLEEVSIFSYRLTSNDPKAMKLKKPTIPDNKDIREPGLPSPAGLANPIDAIYQLFDKRIKQLKILEAYKKRDRFQDKLEEGNNREILLTVTGMDEWELKPFLFYCQMGPEFIQTATDYELLMSLLRCFRSYVHDKEMSEFFSDYD
jgi:hypothetical protein